MRRLARRFEVLVTLVVAPAGYGKTSSLSQALAVPDVGRDVWVQCGPADADPNVFGHAVLQSAGVPAADLRGGSDWAGRIADALARYAPEPVCLVLDDVHRVPPGSPTWRLIEEVLDRMPRNAHVLLSSRVVPPLALARRQVTGAVEQVGTADLEFDDGELAQIHHEPLLALGEAARWPAVSALTAIAAPVGPVEFLVEELISAWPTDRRVVLTALAHLADVDDSAARAASDGAWDATSTFAGLPLVHRSSSGTYQLHDLWRQALTGTYRADRKPEVADALIRVGDHVLGAGRYIEAADLYRAAGARERLGAAIEAFAGQPFMLVPASDALRMTAIARDALGEAPTTELLGCVHAAIVGDERAAAEGFAAVAEGARRVGDVASEALALMHAVNMFSVADADAIPAWLGERAAELEVNPRAHWAATASAMARFHALRARGQSDAAAAVLQTLGPPSNDRELVTYAFGMIDLGRPEQIDAVFDPATGGPAASRLDLAAGAWLRGAVSPEVALALGAELLDGGQRAGFPHIEIPTNATFALVALAAGHTTTARELADAAAQRCAATACVDKHVFSQLADALCVMCARGEADAVPLLEAALARRPIGAWPAEPYLFALPTVYALVPATRPALDACRFGPALTAALDAGKALVALRHDGDARPAAALAWDRPDLLRVHVMPPHLAELAAAATAVGNGDAGRLIDLLPAPRKHLAAVAGHAHEPTARWAAARVATMPARPDVDLAIDVLGPIRLRRGAVTVVDADWVKRDRVRQLLAYLVVRRRATRRAIAEALWPELSDDRASHNLRVNLAHLQRVLQPGRDAEVLPWFVQADGDWLILAGDGVAVDADRFDDVHRAARRGDEQGRSRDALAGYLAALELVRGWYLEDLGDGGWAEVERLRMRTLVIGTRCRAGELLLARGEPEEAARLAGAVLGDEPLQERAGRLLVHSLAAQGDRATARRALAELLARLSDQGLRSEPETGQLARQHGLPDWQWSG